MRLALAALAALLLLLPAAARAESGPPALPTRDVDVTYQLGQEDRAVRQRSRFSAELQRSRLDTLEAGFYVVIDYRAHTMTAVSVPERRVIELPAPADMPGTAPKGDSIRRGATEVAGLACTEWEMRDTQGQAATAYFTADGVMLRARHGAQTMVVATRVDYGRLDPALFAPPPGFERLAPPGKP